MMKIFFTADTHFGHTKVITFESSTRAFSSIEEHDEELIKRWNDRVRPKDIIWHLGDVYFGKKGEGLIGLMKRLNGHKQLIRGNHDTLPTSDYLECFEGIYGVWPKYDFVMSHVPLHPDSVDRWGLNVHGHLHSNSIDDPRYRCVSVEHTNLAPISLDELRTK